MKQRHLGMQFSNRTLFSLCVSAKETCIFPKLSHAKKSVYHQAIMLSKYFKKPANLFSMIGNLKSPYRHGKKRLGLECRCQIVFLVLSINAEPHGNPCSADMERKNHPHSRANYGDFHLVQRSGPAMSHGEKLDFASKQMILTVGNNITTIKTS